MGGNSASTPVPSAGLLAPSFKDQWIASRINAQQPSPLGATGILTNYDPSWRDQAADVLATVSNKIGGKPYSEARRDSMTLLGLAPGTGQVMAAEDAVRAGKQGDYLGAALAGLGAIPEIGPEVRALATGERAPLRMYHTTRGTFDKFGPAPEYRGSTYLATSPEAASKGASGGAQDWYATEGPKPSWRTLEVEVPNEGIQGLHWTPEEVDWFNSLPGKVVGDNELDAALAHQPKNSSIIWDDVYTPNQIGDRLYEYTKAASPREYTLEEAAKTGRDVYRRQLPGYQDSDRDTAKRLRAQGMKGFLVRDEGGVSLAHIDPEIINIVRKYGIPAALGAGLITEEMARQMQQQGQI